MKQRIPIPNPITVAGEKRLQEEREYALWKYRLRTERFVKLVEIEAPEFILRNEQKLINEAIDELCKERQT